MCSTNLLARRTIHFGFTVVCPSGFVAVVVVGASGNIQPETRIKTFIYTLQGNLNFVYMRTKREMNTLRIILAALHFRRMCFVLLLLLRYFCLTCIRSADVYIILQHSRAVDHFTTLPEQSFIWLVNSLDVVVVVVVRCEYFWCGQFSIFWFIFSFVSSMIHFNVVQYKEMKVRGAKQQQKN